MIKTNQIKIALTFFALLINLALGWCQSKVGSEYYNPQWSPDGSSIVFESTKDGKYGIYTIAPDGSGLRKITDTVSNYGQPGWSPDGKSLVYYGGSHPMQLFTNSSSGGEQKLLATLGLDAYEPS